MKKNYVLDTNVLLHDPRAIYKFEDNDLILPIFVLEEIDNFKRDATERGRNARTVSRLLDVERNKGSLSKGVFIGEEGGTLRVHVPESRKVPSVALSPTSGDHAILQTALDIKESSELPTVFVTMDVNLRIRGDALGLQTQAYENQSIDIDRLNTGIVDVEVDAATLDRFFEEGAIESADPRLYANACVMLRDDSPRPRTGLGRFRVDRGGEIRALRLLRDGVMGIRPRNKEQSFALDLLTDDHVRLVTVVGKAGTGKTLLALAAGLRGTAEEGVYGRLLVSRPVMPMGKDLGYLPGTLQEKLDPWMQPIFDNLEFLLVAGGGKRRGMRSFDELFEGGQIQVEPLTYIRGRSLPQQYVIVDEAQNLTPHEVKTIITRVGEGSKIVLTGDPFQIDNPYVDATSNGLTYVAERLRGEALVGHVLLAKGERSELANIAANKL